MQGLSQAGLPHSRDDLSQDTSSVVEVVYVDPSYGQFEDRSIHQRYEARA